MDQLFLQAGAGNVARGLQTGLQGIAQNVDQQYGQFSDEVKSKIDALSGMSQARADEIQNLLQYGQRL